MQANKDTNGGCIPIRKTSVRRKWNDIFKKLQEKKKTILTRILYTVKMPFTMRVKTFSDE